MLGRLSGAGGRPQAEHADSSTRMRACRIDGGSARSELDPVIVKRIFIEKSAKGIMALGWKAGLSGRMGVQMQQRMGRVAPSEVLMPGDDDDYPLSEDELRWQLEFFTDLCAKGTG